MSNKLNSFYRYMEQLLKYRKTDKYIQSTKYSAVLDASLDNRYP